MFYEYLVKKLHGLFNHKHKDIGNINRKFNSRLLGTLVLSLVLALSLIAPSLTGSYAAGLSPTYIGFTSDIHGNTSNLSTWLGNLKTIAEDLEMMALGGDYASYNNDSNSWSFAEDCKNTVLTHYGNETKVVRVRGNHDLQAGDYDKGLVYNGSEFAVYVLDSSAPLSPGGSASPFNYPTEEINDLDNKLRGISQSKPVFVLTHRPIHTFGTRSCGNADEILNVLNKYENTIFVWGHNHSQSDPAYGVVKVKGDTINVGTSNANRTINFTYLSYGGMNEGAGKNVYGMLATLSSAGNDTDIDFNYLNLSGNEVSNTGGNVKIAGTGTENGEYKLVNAPEDGKTYIVVGELGGEYYALTPEVSGSGYLKGKKVTVSGDKVISSVSNDMLWKFTNFYDGFSIVNDGDKYLYRKGSSASSSVYIGTANQYDGADAEKNYKRYGSWLYDEQENSLRNESSGSGTATKYYLLARASGSEHQFYISETKNTKIYLFEAGDVPPIQTYTVTFNSNGGSAVSAITGVAENATITLPTSTKANHAFEGWFTDNNTFNNRFTNSTPVTVDITLYAKWTEKTVTPGEPSYELVNSPTDGETYVVTAKYGNSYYALTTDAIDTKYLKGKLVTVINDAVVASDVDSKMLWKFTDFMDGFSIVNGGDKYLYRIGSSSDQGIKTGSANEYDDPGDIDIQNKNYRRYGDWLYNSTDHILRIESPESGSGEHRIYYMNFRNSSRLEFHVTQSSDTEIYLYKLIEAVAPPVETFTVRFLDWDDTVLSTQIVVEGEDAQAPVDPVRTGYAFVGWDKDYTNITEDVDVKALYRINEYVVTFDSKGGSAVDSVTTEYNSTITLPTAPVKEGFTFKGWFVDDSTFANKFTDATLVTANITVYAKWEAVDSPVETFTVRFLDFDDTVLSTQVVEEGEDAIAPTDPSRTGYTFTGWDKVFTNITGNLDVKAKWEATTTDTGSSDTGSGRPSRRDDEPETIPDEDIPEAVPYTGFKDVAEDAWYYNSVKFVTENEMFKGISTELFGPDINISRGMYVTILSRMEFGNDEEVPEGTSPFTDLTQDWYKNAVAWAYENKITLGTSATEFSPDLILTREQMATLLFRYAEYKEYDIGYELETSEVFTDFDTVSEYAQGAMLWAFKNDLLAGIEEVTLEPRGLINRALAADMFMRFYEKIRTP